MKNSEWKEKFLEAVSSCSSEGKEAVEYIRTRNTHVGIKRARKSVGAFWTLTGAAYLNSAHHSQESSLVNPSAWVLLIHEVRHLQQGMLTAFSIYGELDAWQYEFRLFKRLTGKKLKPELEELLTLPLNFDRANLKHAQRLMTKYAGFWYGAWSLPLYPLHKELLYWVTRRQSD